MKTINVDDIHYRTYDSQVRIVQGIDKVMFETFLLRVHYLNDFDNVDCRTCLFILMQSRNNNKMLQLKVQCSIYNYECDALYDCIDGAT
jgi:hypothetical protein